MKKDIKPGEIYITSEPEYVGSFPVRTELEVLPASHPPAQGWTIQKIVAINGNKYLRLLSKYLKKTGKASEDDLTEEEIEKLYSKCEY